jgi:hypothetical protein
MTTSNTAAEIIGDLGEVVVQEFFNSTRSVYKYDAEKDGYINEMKYAVKTFRLNKSTRGFWMSDNYTKIMWKNVDAVPLLFFIRVPETIDDLAELYLAIDHRNSYNMVSTNNGVKCRNYPLTNCLKICNISEDRSRMLYENSVKLRRVA